MRKTGKLAGLFSDLVRTKGDDALRLASNYGDDVFRAAGMYGDDMLNFGANYTDDVLGAVSRMDDINYGARIDALSDNLLTPKSNIAVGMGNPPPVKEPLFKGDVRMNPDSSFSVLSADDVYDIENDWLTQDMLNRGELNNVGSRFKTTPTNLNDLYQAGYGKLHDGVLLPDLDSDLAREFNAFQRPENPYEFLKNPAALNWGGAEGAQNMFEIEKYLDSLDFDYQLYDDDYDTISKLYQTLKKRDAAGLPNLRKDLIEKLGSARYIDAYTRHEPWVLADLGINL